VDDGRQRLDPRMRWVLLVPWCLATVLPALALAIGAAVTGESAGALIAAAAAIALLLAGWVRAAMILRRWSYRFGEHALELTHGWIVHRTSVVPYHRIQTVEQSAGPMMRWFGLVGLTLRTASASTDGTIPGLQSERADALRRELAVRAGRDDAV
jgi:membrane protein YdbS with pleckstrin-like domain